MDSLRKEIALSRYASGIDEILEKELKILVKSINSYAKDLQLLMCLMDDEVLIVEQKLKSILNSNCSIYDKVKKLEHFNNSLAYDYEHLDVDYSFDGWSFE